MIYLLLLLSGGGIPVVLLLISYEVQIEKLCQYCTMAHLANVLVLVTSARVYRATQTNTWMEMSRDDLVLSTQRGRSEEA